MPRPSWIPTLLLLALGVWPSAGWAGPPAPARPPSDVLVGASSCADPAWAPGVWAGLLRVELAADGIRVHSADDAPASPEPAGPRVEADPAVCGGAAPSATLVLSIGDQRRTRTVQLYDVDPVARPRVIAIAMAELVRAGVAAAKPEAVAPTPGSMDVYVRFEGPRPAPPPAAALFAAAETKVFGQQGTAVAGARAGIELPFVRHAALGLDLGALAGTAQDPLGGIDATLATLGASLHLIGGSRSLSFGVGPRFEAGVGWFRGSAAAPLATRAASATSPLAFLTMSGVASFAIQGRWSGLVGLDVGTSVYGFRTLADQRTVSTFAGPMLAARLGFAWNLGSP